MISSLAQFWSFNHAACDVLLQQHNVSVPGAFSPGKSGFAKDTTYSGTIWVGVITLFLGWASAYVWLKSGTLTRQQHYARYTMPIFLIAALTMLVLQLNADAQYVDICKKLLPG
jgi:membrane-anchored protein YejM (alkaline phosphatase superfamily)